MMDRIEIDGYRGIKQSTLTGFRQLNVLIGPNGVGKSAVLQSVPLGLGQTSIIDWFGSRVGLFRGDVRRNAFFDIITKIKVVSGDGKNIANAPIEVVFKRRPTDRELSWSPGGTLVLQDLEPSTRWSDVPYWHDTGLGEARSTAFLPSAPDLFGYPGRFEDLVTWVITSGRRRKLLGLLKPLLPQLADIRMVTFRGAPTICVEEENDELWPVASAGDGLKRLFGLAAFMALDVKWRFIEEPEVHQHHASTRQVARLIWDGVDEQKQVFVTTHSLPLLRELLAHCDGREALMRVHVLKRESGKVTADSWSAEQARAKDYRGKLEQALDPGWPG